MEAKGQRELGAFIQCFNFLAKIMYSHVTVIYLKYVELQALSVLLMVKCVTGFRRETVGLTLAGIM